MNQQFVELSSLLSLHQKSLLVKALDNPVYITVSATADRLLNLNLITEYAEAFSLTGLGTNFATWLQAQFLAEEEEPETGDRWRIVFEITNPRTYGSFASTEQFRDHVFVRDSVEARAVSAAHSVIRARYPLASKIVAIAREFYQNPADIDQPIEFIPIHT